MTKSGNRPGREAKKPSAAQKSTVRKISPSNPSVPTQREGKDEGKVQVQAHVRSRASVADAARLKSGVRILTAHPQTEGQKPTILSKDTKSAT